MAEIFFLSGLPRSGSTLLGSLIGQNPDFTVTPTSPFLDLLCYTDKVLNSLDQKYTYDKKTISDNVYRGIVNNYYKHIKTKYILDKHRGHPKNIIPIKMYICSKPKIICCLRPISEVICSYIKLIEDNQQSNNFVDNYLRDKNIPINTANRASCLWNEYIQDSYQSMIIGIKNHRDNIHIVEYDKLVADPQKSINKIYSFLEIQKFDGHFFENIHNYCSEEKDAEWGLENLHSIRSKVQKTSTDPKKILGPHLADYYNKFNLVY